MDKKKQKIKRIVWNILWDIVGIAIIIYMIWKKSYFNLILCTIWIVFTGLFFYTTDEAKEKIIKVLKITAIIIFVLTSLFGKLIPSQLFTWGITLPLWYFLLTFLLRKSIKKKNIKKSVNLEKRVKNDLNIYSRTYRKSFPKFANWIGGFVLPIIPFFSFINKNWKKKLDKEAVIHENVHLYYLQNGGIIFFFLVMVLIITMAGIGTKFIFPGINTELILLKDYVMYPFVYIFSLIGMVFFEYITFKKTNKIGNKLKIKTRKWEWKICFKYIWIYAIQLAVMIGLVYGIIKGIEILWRIIF